MRGALEQLSVWLARAAEEGRAALNSLRSSTAQKNDLAEALRRVTKDDLMELASVSDFLIDFCLKNHVTKQSLLAKMIKISIQHQWPELDVQSPLAKYYAIWLEQQVEKEWTRIGITLENR